MVESLRSGPASGYVQRMGFNIFTWSAGKTFGTWLFTRRKGQEVGRDSDGNIYYESTAGNRWIIYAVDNDSSRVPPEWHGWLHHTTDVLPAQETIPVRAWQKPWRPNPTGTSKAEMPKGALASAGVRARAAADYRAWSPDEA